MSDREEKEASLITEVIVALVYSVVILFCTIQVQKAVSGFLDQFEQYIGNILVTILSFFVSMFLSQITKAIVNFSVGKHFLSRYFVIAACVFLVFFSAVFSGDLLIWWATAVSAVFSTLLTFGKKLFKRKVKEKVKEVKESVRDVRQIEHDLRHGSIDEAKHLMKKMRGKF